MDDNGATIRTMDDHLLDRWATAMYGAGRSERTVTERTALIRRVAMQTRLPSHGLTTDALASWLAHQKISKASRETYMAHMRAWSVWLILHDVREDDPTVKLVKACAPKRQPRPITTEQFEAVLAVRMRRTTRTMILLAAYEGFRVHEIAKIRGEDVDLIGGTLRVVGKGSVEAWLPLHPLIAREAKRYSRRGYWFPKPSTRFDHVHRCSVSDVIRRAMYRADVDASAHQLRHWFGTQLLKSGADARTVQTLMRHQSLATTALYTQVDAAQQRTALDRLPRVA